MRYQELLKNTDRSNPFLELAIRLLQQSPSKLGRHQPVQAPQKASSLCRIGSIYFWIG